MQLVKFTAKDPNTWIATVNKETDKVFTALGKLKKIKNMDHFNEVAGSVKILKKLAKEAKTKKPKKVDPFGEFASKVNKLDKAMKVILVKFIADNKVKIAALDAQVSSGKLKNISSYVSKAAALSVDSDFASTRKQWKAIIVDEAKIPRTWLMPDTAKIVNHLKEGGKPIPGVSWEQDETLAI